MFSGCGSLTAASEGVFQGQGRKVGLSFPDFQVPSPWRCAHRHGNVVPAPSPSQDRVPRDQAQKGLQWPGVDGGSGQWIPTLEGALPCLVVDERLLSSGFGMLGASPPPGRHLWR